MRSCLRQGASLVGGSVSADSGREGEITAGVGRVRLLNCLSIPPYGRIVVVDELK